MVGPVILGHFEPFWVRLRRVCPCGTRVGRAWAPRESALNDNSRSPCGGVSGLPAHAIGATVGEQAVGQKQTRHSWAGCGIVVIRLDQNPPAPAQPPPWEMLNCKVKFTLHFNISPMALLPYGQNIYYIYVILIFRNYRRHFTGKPYATK